MWWRAIKSLVAGADHEAEKFCDVAERLASCICSSADVERLFSAFVHILSLERVSMATDRLSRVAFVHRCLK